MGSGSSRGAGWFSASLLLDQRLERFARDPEAFGGLSGERRGGDTGHEAEDGLLVGIELDLKERQIADRRLLREPGGELQEVSADERLGTQPVQKRDDKLDDLLTF